MASHIDVRFRFLEVRRLTNLIEGPVNVHNNSTVKRVAKIEGKLTVEFAYTCTYEPGIGLIRIEGDVILTDTDENIERAVREWEKTGKNLPTDIAEKVHNAILGSSIVESVLLSKEVGLPAPIPTPTVSLTKKEEGKTKPGSDTNNYIR